tara:strand:- start:136 stop:354 length:219 start_codon:yes stop_codon:yes gene_type:complete
MASIVKETYDGYTISGRGIVRKVYDIIEEHEDHYVVELKDTNASMYSGSGFFTTIQKNEIKEGHFGNVRLID